MKTFVHRGAIAYLHECVKGEVLCFAQEGNLQRFGAILKKELSNVNVTYFSTISPNTKKEEIEAAISSLRGNQVDVILAFGGGSVIDFAKGFRFYTNHKVPLIAIPTTAGTGSEATQFAVIYENGKKTSLDATSVLPDVAIADSLFIENAPRVLKASCAMDAFAQAIESFWAKGATLESREYALDAIRLCRAHIVEAVNSSNPTANEQMMQAAHLAGKAINISRTTAAHALSYKITSAYGIPHGHAVALMLPQIFLLNLGFIRDVDVLLSALGLTRETILPYFNNLMRAIGLENNFFRLGINDLPTLANSVDPNRLSNNPRPLTKEEILMALQNASNQILKEGGLSMEFTPEEKQRIFIARTKTFWPELWTRYEAAVERENWSKAQMEEYNFNQRKAIVKYAYENSPFYKRYYDSVGLLPDDIRTEKDWLNVPIVTKDMMREYGEEFVVERERPFACQLGTGGSTGKPLKVYGDNRSEWGFSLSWRDDDWFSGRIKGAAVGIIPTLGQDIVWFTRVSQDPSVYRDASMKRFPQRSFYFDLAKMGETDMFCYVKKMAMLQARNYGVRCYTAGAFAFAEFCLQNKIRITPPKFVRVNSSVLTPAMRNILREAFQCPILDAYGSVEMGGYIAIEHALNPNENEHYVQSDFAHLELVGEKDQIVSDGEIGATVVTSFMNHVAPLIRYKQGDFTSKIQTPDPLEMPFPRIGAIQGRQSEWLLMKNGGRVCADRMSEWFDEKPHCVKAFQFRQKKGGGGVRMLYILNPDYPDSVKEMELVKQEIAETFTGSLDFTFEAVKELPHDRGKMRLIFNE